MVTVADLAQEISEKNNVVDFNLLERAAKFSSLANTQDSYEHSLRLAKILVGFGVTDPKTLAAAILHDVTEQGAAKESDLEKEFGSEISNLVKKVAELKVISAGRPAKSGRSSASPKATSDTDGLSGAAKQLADYKLVKDSSEKFAENLRKMFLAMATDLRVVLIKLVDIFDNLKNPQKLDKIFLQNLAKSTLEIFAPLSARLGIGELKGQLEDLAFPIFDTENYSWVTKFSKKAYEATDKMLLKVKAKLVMELAKTEISAEIHGRKKYIYSLYKKLLRPEIGKDLSKIYDLVALRVIVDSLEDCYKVLGTVHKLWRPKPAYVRDYIAAPKPNGYQSLHTTVFGPENKPFEIQIRTRTMHKIDEFGVAASWHYSERKAKGATDKQVESGFSVPFEKLNWLRQLAEWQKEVGNLEFLKGLKFDFFADRVFVFTPKGDVKDLPKGATPVDFAYSVHTELGRMCSGAKVDGKLVSLNYQLKTGEVCEIIPVKNGKHKPSAHWLNFVKTNLAKREIKKQLAK